MAPSAIVETPVVQGEFTPSHYAPIVKENPVVEFDPAKHLDYAPPSKILTMKDLGLEPTALSPVATTEPFPLLSHEGVLQHRRDLFSKDVLANCVHKTRESSIQIRGMAPRYSTFIHQFWHSPEVLKIVSDIAGVELIPALDYEISHANVQLGPGGMEEFVNTPVEPPAATEEAISRFGLDVQKEEDFDVDKAIVDWHRDSHPWVCVVMLSDARYMSGGETILRTGDGSTMPVIAPQMGHAVLLQGRYISHTAATVTNMPERVTIVTSFRPKNPAMLDETTNANVRDKSHLTELYYQWTTYRLEVMAQRARIAADALKERYEKNIKESDPDGKGGHCRVETVNVDEVRQWGEEMIKYIQETMHEMRPLGE